MPRTDQRSMYPIGFLPPSVCHTVHSVSTEGSGFLVATLKRSESNRAFPLGDAEAVPRPWRIIKSKLHYKLLRTGTVNNARDPNPEAPPIKPTPATRRLCEFFINLPRNNLRGSLNNGDPQLAFQSSIVRATNAIFDLQSTRSLLTCESPGRCRPIASLQSPFGTKETRTGVNIRMVFAAAQQTFLRL